MCRMAGNALARVQAPLERLPEILARHGEVVTCATRLHVDDADFGATLSVAARIGLGLIERP